MGAQKLFLMFNLPVLFAAPIRATNLDNSARGDRLHSLINLGNKNEFLQKKKKNTKEFVDAWTIYVGQHLEIEHTQSAHNFSQE